MNDDEFSEIVRATQDDLHEIRVLLDSLAIDYRRVVRENNLLRGTIDELRGPPLDYTDDMADAAIERQGEADWQRSTDRYARGERE